MITRRSIFSLLAGAAALPLISKIPVVQRVGAWAMVKIEAGAITSVSIINAGSGYNSSPTIDFK